MFHNKLLLIQFNVKLKLCIKVDNWGIEPHYFGFSVQRLNQLSYLSIFSLLYQLLPYFKSTFNVETIFIVLLYKRRFLDELLYVIIILYAVITPSISFMNGGQRRI